MRTVAMIGALALSGMSLTARADVDPKVERMWRAKCAGCHGADGKGDTEQGKKSGVSDMTAKEWQKISDDSMKKGINEGVKREKGGKKQEMDGFAAKLKPEQVDALVGFVRGFAK
jgi:mono/diheme cytochrome c family protein